jgi:hypothetical protein
VPLPESSTRLLDLLIARAAVTPCPVGELLDLEREQGGGWHVGRAAQCLVV